MFETHILSHYRFFACRNRMEDSSSYIQNFGNFSEKNCVLNLLSLFRFHQLSFLRTKKLNKWLQNVQASNNLNNIKINGKKQMINYCGHVAYLFYLLKITYFNIVFSALILKMFVLHLGGGGHCCCLKWRSHNQFQNFSDNLKLYLFACKMHFRTI